MESIVDLFPAAARVGLSETQVAESRSKFGANRLTPLPRPSAWRKFLEKFDDAIIKILLAASLLKIVVDLFERSALAGVVALIAGVALVGVLYAFRWTRWVPTSLFGLAIALFGTSVALAHPSYDGLAVMIAVILATGVSFLSEYRSDREFEKLNAHKEAARSKVVRAGTVVGVPQDEVVVGDLVVLEAGDEIPADGRVVAAQDLSIDQSLMTGESEPVKKEKQDAAVDGPEQVGDVYRGTQVVDGIGRMTVTNVGDDTMLGQIARRLSGGVTDPDESDLAGGRVQQKLTISKELTPLQLKLNRLAKLISRVGYAASGLIFVALVVRGLMLGELNPATIADSGQDPQGWVGVVGHLLDYFVYMVIVIVVAVPEGLPMSVTVSLALAMRKMTRSNALVRQLVATETIGSATVICTDKTGTLTLNQMRVERLVAGGRTSEVGSPTFTPVLGRADDQMSYTPTDWIAVNAAVNSTGTLEQKADRRVVIGNSTEGALLIWLADAGVDFTHERQTHLVLFRSVFSSEHKRMSCVAELGGRPTALMKGAPEIVLERCTHLLEADGGVRPLSDADRTAIRADLSSSAVEAMRTLAFAHKLFWDDFPREASAIAERRVEFEEGLIFDGFVAIRDPIRPDVPAAITECRAAGIAVKMITGDNPETARAIATEIGLLDTPDALVLTSADLAELSDDELKAKLPSVRVVARAKPLDKYRLVQLLQEMNQVVAMTGDGTNDAPSLKQADVGLSMGITGTEVAKEASKIVLLDDAFGTIVKAVHWGRALYENIQKFIVFQLTINLSALLIAFLGPFLGLKPPFTVLQLLWINVIMDTFAAIALCSEPPRPGLMTHPPKRRDENILTRRMLGTIASTGLLFVLAMICLLFGMRYVGWFAADSGANPAGWQFDPLNVRQVTIFFTVYVFFQVWNQINCRSLTADVSGLQGLFKNPLFLLIASFTVLGQWLIVQFGGAVFDVEALRWMDWLVIVGGTAVVLLYAEGVRWVRRFAASNRGNGTGVAINS